MKLIWTQKAAEDLAEIRSFLGTRNPAAADRMAGRVGDAVKRVGKYPEAGPVSLDGIIRQLAIPTTPNVLIYLVTSGRVLILHIFHGARDR